MKKIARSLLLLLALLIVSDVVSPMMAQAQPRHRRHSHRRHYRPRHRR